MCIRDPIGGRELDHVVLSVCVDRNEMEGGRGLELNGVVKRIEVCLLVSLWSYGGVRSERVRSGS